ncbi:MAG: DUF58 domain-containing protein [Pirellulales bacterium]
MSWLSEIHPLLIFLAPLVPLAIVGYFFKIYPRWPLALAWTIPVLISLAIAFLATFFDLDARAALPIVYVVDVVLFVLALIDALSLPWRRDFAVRREALRIVSLRKPHEVRLILESRASRTVAVEMRDDVPPEFRAEPADFREIPAPRSRSTMEYGLTASRRGAHVLEKVYLRARSRWSLWHRDLAYDTATTLHVYPDLKQLEEYAILARTNRLSLLGVRRTRRIGQDNEFERLRDFTRDDNFKHIEWRSTARRRKLTVKDFQTNQSQRVVFLIDCGRMMTNRSGGLSLLDHAFNSMLMMSYVALNKGDSVGLLCFSDQIHCYVPPKSGANQMNRLLHACFDRFPRLVESRYDEAFLYLDTHCRKRSLVVLTTNLIDEVNAEQVHRYLGNSATRHLSMGVLLRDRTLFDAAEKPPQDDDDLYRAAAAADLLLWRSQVLTRLETLGVRALDVFPEDLTAPLVNAYLDIKARHLL